MPPELNEEQLAELETIERFNQDPEFLQFEQLRAIARTLEDVNRKLADMSGNVGVLTDQPETVTAIQEVAVSLGNLTEILSRRTPDLTPILKEFVTTMREPITARIEIV